MWCILIHGVPPGCPLGIRETWWAGLTLPLYSTNLVPAGRAQNITSSRPSTHAGYAVDSSLAFGILKLHRPKAMELLGQEAFRCSQTDALLVFKEETCGILDGLPSVTLPQRNKRGAMSVKQLLLRLTCDPDLKGSVCVRDMLETFSQDEWGKIASASITRPLIDLLCFAVAGAAEKRTEEADSNASEGSRFFDAMHCIAEEQGIQMDRKEMNRPSALGGKI